MAATAKTTTNNPDWTAGVDMVRTRSGLFIICDVNRFQGSPMDVERSIINQAGLDGTKVTIRAAPLASQAEAGNVKLLVTGDPARDAWVAPFLDEMSMFPAGAHDDQVDAAADAFSELALGGSSYDIRALG
jgi:phage terminase large subunit-like protein